VVLYEPTRVRYEAAMARRDHSLAKTYKRLRTVEETLFDTLSDAVPDAAVDAIAAAFRMEERGEALYDHPDYGPLLDLALHEHLVDGKTTVEAYLAATAPDAGSDPHTILAAMTRSRVTLLRLGARDGDVALQVEDVLFGGSSLLVDPELAEDRTRDEVVILARVLPFDGWSMLPSSSYLDFDPELARMLAAGLPKETGAATNERFASAESRRQLARDLTHMALASVDSVKAALVKRFGGAESV
jgi:hypothetical protein